MRTWFLVTKDVLCWEKLDDEEQLNLTVNQPVRKDDKVLIYKTSPHNHISHIFIVQNDAYKHKNGYKLHLHKKTKINQPVRLSELKEKNILKGWQKSFKKSFYHVPLCVWGDIIGCINENNPKLFEPFKFVGCSGPNEVGCPVNYKNEFINEIKTIKSYNLHSFDEEAAKYRIILPLLSKIGWDIYNLKEVYPEYPVRYKNKKVDYLLTDYTFHKTFIEAKMPFTNLDEYQCQLMGYCASMNVDFGVLTDGIIWRFYHLHYYDNIMGALKKCRNWNFDEINLLDDEPEVVWNKFIEFFWKNKLSKSVKLNKPDNLEKILQYVKNINYNDKIYFNESAVKQTIVLPILYNLGWDLTNERKLIFDNRAGHKKIDYILGMGMNKIFLEVKALTEDLGVYDILEKHEEHLLKFGDSAGLNFGVLTNGDIWKFYHLKTRDRIKIKISDEDIDKSIKGLKALLSKNQVMSKENIDYLESKA